MANQFQMLSIASLSKGAYQPRQAFDSTKLQELAESIRQQGLIEPLVVREQAMGVFEIIAGERRFRAAQIAGLTTVPCMIGEYTDEQAASITLIENIQREDLNLIEEGRGYQRLMLEFRFQQDEVAAIVGKSRSHIANILRLLTLDDAVQSAIKSGDLGLGHARMLVGLSPEVQQQLLSKIRANHCSVRELEAMVRQLKAMPADIINKQESIDMDIKRLERSLSEHVGAPVEISSEMNHSGWLKIKYFNHETLSGLLQRLGLLYD